MFGLLDEAFRRGRDNLPGYDTPPTWRENLVGIVELILTIVWVPAGLTIAFGPWLYGAFKLVQMIWP